MDIRWIHVANNFAKWIIRTSHPSPRHDGLDFTGMDLASFVYHVISILVSKLGR